jgi:hypothetical protein
METLSPYISLLFGTTTLLTVFIFYKAANSSRLTLFVLLGWLLLQTIIGLSGFYTVTDRMPPRLMLLVLPPVISIAVLLLSPAGKKYLAGLNIKALTILHIVRIPVEIVLLLLFLHKVVPQRMTFEEHNFDIISGISAPLIYYFGLMRNQLNTKIILVWNFICLGLLINIVVTAILSVPAPFQRFGFEQPNTAILYFPFVWLPGCVVPLVLLAHLAAIKQLLQTIQKKKQEPAIQNA